VNSLGLKEAASTTTQIRPRQQPFSLEVALFYMKVNHINLTVTDVQAANAFLEKYFALRGMGGNAGMAFLSDEDGFVLTLMKAGTTMPFTYPGNFHIGFFVESEAVVDEINRRLKEAGYDVKSAERHHAYGFYVAAPGGFTVEVGA
jgi:catechol-2,3-dioxygenase